MKPFRIREAAPADIGEKGEGGIRDLYNAARRHERSEGRSPLAPPQYGSWVGAMERQADGKPANQVLVAEDTKGNIVGFALAHHGKNLEHSTIGKLVIDPEYQGQGMGRKLLEKIQIASRQQGKNEIRVCAEHGEGRASEFYQRLGFEVEGRYTTDGGIRVDKLVCPTRLSGHTAALAASNQPRQR